MFGRDVRRLRPNLMIGGVEGMAERTWPGAILRLPEAEIGLADLRSRCVMTTYDPETAEQDPAVLRDIVPLSRTTLFERSCHSGWPRRSRPLDRTGRALSGPGKRMACRPSFWASAAAGRGASIDSSLKDRRIECDNGLDSIVACARTRT